MLALILVCFGRRRRRRRRHRLVPPSPAEWLTGSRTWCHLCLLHDLHCSVCIWSSPVSAISLSASFFICCHCYVTVHTARQRVWLSVTVVVCVLFLQWFDTVGWATGRASGLYNIGCWFVGGDDFTVFFTGALHVLQLQLQPPSRSFLAPIKPRMKTFLYWLTQVCVEKWLLKWGKICLCSQTRQGPVLLTVLWTLRTQWYVCVSETGVCINSGVKAKHIGTKLISHDKISLLLYTSPLCGTVRPTAIRLHGMCIVYVADVKMTSVFMMP